MKKVALLALVVSFGFSSVAMAHIDPPNQPGYLGLAFNFQPPPVVDGNLGDWLGALTAAGITDAEGDGYAISAVNYTPTSAGEKKEFDAADLDFTLWYGWSPDNNKFYFAYTMFDNIHQRDIDPGKAPTVDARHAVDDAEIMFDADHSGGIYYLSSTDDNPLTDEEVRKLRNSQAQQYEVGWPNPDEFDVVYNGFATWLVLDPALTKAGYSYSGDPTGEGTLSAEFMCTPMNDVDADGGTFTEHQLVEGQVVGSLTSFIDFDDGTFIYFVNQNGQDATFTDADKFVDVELDSFLGAATPTAVESSTWGRIKSGFSN